MSSIKSCKACGADNDIIFDNCVYCKKPLERIDINMISNEELIAKTGEWIGKSRSDSILLPPPEGKSTFWTFMSPSVLNNGQIRGYAQKYLSMLSYRASQNPEIKAVYDDLQSKYNKTKTFNPARSAPYVLLGLFALMIIFALLYRDPSLKEKEKEKQRIEQVISEVRQEIAEKDYDSAIIKSSEIMWTDNVDEDTLLVRQYNLQREEIQKTIRQLKSEEEQER